MAKTDDGVGARIAGRRKQLGLTQAELADLLNVDTVSVSRWETGGVKPTRNLYELCRVLRVDRAWLLSGPRNYKEENNGPEWIESRIPIDEIKKRLGRLSQKVAEIAFRLERFDDVEIKKVENLIDELETQKALNPKRYEENTRVFNVG